jgi:hypothetical protein
MNLFIGIALAFIYWIGSLFLFQTGYKFPLGISKWFAALFTHSNLLAPMLVANASPTIIFAVKISRLKTLFRWITITAYSLGDIVLVWDEPSSLPFFGIGHVAFIIATSASDLIPGIAAAVCHHVPAICDNNVLIGDGHVMYYIGIAHVCSVSLTAIVSVFWVMRNGYKSILAYGLYMYTLAMALFVGLCYESYGVVLFVISDIIIGFRIHRLHLLSYPLYYASLIYFSLHSA